MRLFLGVLGGLVIYENLFLHISYSVVEDAEIIKNMGGAGQVLFVTSSIVSILYSAGCLVYVIVNNRDGDFMKLSYFGLVQMTLMIIMRLMLLIIWIQKRALMTNNDSGTLLAFIIVGTLYAVAQTALQIVLFRRDLAHSKTEEGLRSIL